MNLGGRPTIGPEKLVRVTVFLTPSQFHAAYMAGNGKFSEGLRKQLQELEEVRAWHSAQLAANAPSPTAADQSRRT